MIKSPRKYGTKKNKGSIAPLNNWESVESQFPELNQLLLEGILTFAQRALRTIQS